jgi:hypothetical protein
MQSFTDAELEAAYAIAWEEWFSDSATAAWEIVDADGLSTRK